jgi:hypothetical protein
MTITRYLVGLAVGLALSATAFAQREPTAAPPVLVRPPETNSKQMYEDIEVMRRLVAKRLQGFQAADCQKCHNQPGTKMGGGGGGITVLVGPDGKAVFGDFDADGRFDLDLVHHGLQVNPSEVDGTYLRGHGAVFHVTLPAVARVLATASVKPSSQTLSEWDRTRLQIRGEKAPDASSAPHPPALTDVLLELLAENGKHFGQLSPTESVQLVVTFRKEQPSSDRRGSGGGSEMPGAGSMSDFGAVMTGPPAGGGRSSKPGTGPIGGGSGAGSLEPLQSGPGGGLPTLPGSGGPGSGSGMPPTSDTELLAELHRKQGNWKEVIRVYEEAIRKRPRGQERELSLKLAAAYLELGQLDNAKKILDKIADTKAVPPLPKSGDAPKEAVVYKLIVTAPKSVLDQVGNGKMKFEEFVKKASIETVTVGK